MGGLFECNFVSFYSPQVMLYMSDAMVYGHKVDIPTLIENILFAPPIVYNHLFQYKAVVSNITAVLILTLNCPALLTWGVLSCEQ